MKYHIEQKVERILDKIKNGELNRDQDETGADGFWDLSYELATENEIAETPKEQERVEQIYRTLWEIAERLG